MKALFALATAASVFALAPAAHAATFVPGDPEFRVAGDGTTGTQTVSATVGNIGLNGSDIDNFLFRIGPAGGNFIGLGSGAVTTSFTLGSSNGLIFNSVIFNNGFNDFVIDITTDSEGAAARGNNIPIFSGVLNRLSVNYTATGNASYGGNLTFTPTAAVPEPATWLMMIMGFAAVGFSMRRRKQQDVRVRYAF